MSMSNELIAKRYAIALFELAMENNQLDSYEQEVALVNGIFTQDKQFNQFFSHPRIKTEEKKKVLTDHLQTAISPHVRNTLLLMLDRKRGDCILPMLEQFLQLALKEQSVAEAQVYSVKPLTASEQEEISTMIANKLGKRSLRLENIIDPDIIGGLKIQVGNQIFDGSVSGKLERMKRELIVS